MDTAECTPPLRVKENKGLGINGGYSPEGADEYGILWGLSSYIFTSTSIKSLTEAVFQTKKKQVCGCCYW